MGCDFVVLVPVPLLILLDFSAYWAAISRFSLGLVAVCLTLCFPPIPVLIHTWHTAALFVGLVFSGCVSYCSPKKARAQSKGRASNAKTVLCSH